MIFYMLPTDDDHIPYIGSFQSSAAILSRKQTFYMIKAITNYQHFPLIWISHVKFTMINRGKRATKATKLCLWLYIGTTSYNICQVLFLSGYLTSFLANILMKWHKEEDQKLYKWWLNIELEYKLVMCRIMHAWSAFADIMHWWIN